MLLSVKDIPEAGLDPNVEQNFDAESGQCFFLLEAKQATPYPRAPYSTTCRRYV